MDVPVDPIASMRERLSRHWLARLRREAELGALDRAVALGLLERVEHAGGMSFFKKGKAVVGRTIDRVRRLLQHSAGFRAVGTARVDEPGNEWEIPDDELDNVWAVPAKSSSPATRSGSRSKAVDLMLEDRGECSSATGSSAEPADGDGDGAGALPIAETAGAEGPDQIRVKRKRRRSVDRMALLRLVRSQATPPAATQVTTMLMLADAVARAGHDLADVLATLRRPRPIIAITGTVTGFEASFVNLLKLGNILPGRGASINGYELRSIRDARMTDGAARVFVLFPPRDFASDGSDIVDQQVGLAVQTAYPILAVADERDQIPPLLLAAADLNLVCQPVTPGLLVETMKVVLGSKTIRLSTDQLDSSLPPETIQGRAQAKAQADVGGDVDEAGSSCSGIDAIIDLTAETASSIFEGCGALTLADLALAIRSGMTAERCVALLRSLIDRRQAHETQASPAKATSSSGSSATTRRNKIGSGSTRIEPEPLPEKPDMTETAKARPPLRVETLSGYGKACDWALSLKEDLSLWRAGFLDWPEMSTRLLLAGPPGTGKTTFARALGNSLQLPVFATSVGTWLEPSYLGDVLARMSAAFSEAESNAPCILFVDEIDGIGRRGGTSGRHDEYWHSVVNRALELMDGAIKTQGVVIVGATNHPEAIDPALLRSGRLEARVDIPLPDVDALVGILRHHLGDDAEAIVASAALSSTSGSNIAVRDDPVQERATGDRDGQRTSSRAYSPTRSQWRWLHREVLCPRKALRELAGRVVRQMRLSFGPDDTTGMEAKTGSSDGEQ
jgi:hypothetical protein